MDTTVPSATDVNGSADWPSLGALLALLGLTVLVYVLLYRRRILPNRAPMGFLDHLRELGARFGRVGLLFLYWTVVFTAVRFDRFTFAGVPLAAPAWDLFDNAAARIYLLLARTSLPPDVHIIVTRPTEAVAAQLEISCIVGFLLVFPALAYEAWAFFSPALDDRERRVLARALPVAGVLFVAGAVFAYLYVVPVLFRVLYAFATPLGATAFLSAGALVGTLATFAVLFGFAFELPLVMVLLVRVGVAQPAMYLRRWRHVTVAIFVVAALVTDPTVVSQAIVAAMLLGLYWSGVGLSFLARPVRGERSAPASVA